MAKYLVQASYTAEGAKGLLKEGGTARRAAVEAVVRAAGGARSPRPEVETASVFVASAFRRRFNAETRPSG